MWIGDPDVVYEVRPENQGFVHGDLIFLDGSRLHFREYVDCDPVVERLTYSYNYMRADSTLIFRYDNTPHHFHLGLPSFPDHKHDLGGTQIVQSSRPELADILEEIATFISAGWNVEPDAST